jgi:hypothetical protein
MRPQTSTLAPEEAPDPFGPALSALIFGYWGFLDSTVADTVDDSGATVPLWLGALWILRGTAVLFAVCVGLALLRTRPAAIAYGAVGLLSALGLLAILVWDQLDTKYFFAAHPLILLVCALWNGWASVSSLRRSLA